MIVASNRLRNVPEETDKQLFGSPSPIPQNRQGARKRGPQQVVHLILPRCFASVCAVGTKALGRCVGKSFANRKCEDERDTTLRNLITHTHILTER